MPEAATRNCGRTSGATTLPLLLGARTHRDHPSAASGSRGVLIVVVRQRGVIAPSVATSVGSASG
jgi:hypothetical protein